MVTWQRIKVKALGYLEGFSYFCTCREQGLSDPATCSVLAFPIKQIHFLFTFTFTCLTST